MQNFFDRTIIETKENFNTDLDKGFTSGEADIRLKKFGENRLEGKKSKTLFQMYLAQFKDFLVIILIIAAIISIALGEYIDGSIIIAIVIINAILGASQENKASNALNKLKEMSSPQAKVLRDGQLEKIQSENVVPGDIVILDAGDYIPADLRLIESVNLKVDESSLTGESVPVEKNASQVLSSEAVLGDRVNSAYMSSVVTYGRGRGIVTNTGMTTQMGSIAKMLNDTEEETTPLQKKLDSLGKLLGIVCLIVCGIIFLLGLYHKMELLDIFMTSVSLAVAAIPEGLTVVVTVILAMGMQKMVKSNAIIKRLSAVETLGSTTVICSDKTGTLTQNKMTVVKIFDTQTVFDVTGTGYGKEGTIVDGNNEKIMNQNIEKLLTGAVLCNDSTYNVDQEKIVGDPTEGALLVVGEKVDFNKTRLNGELPRIDEYPFDSERKLMSTFHKNDTTKTLMYTKGAPDEILRRASFIYKNGEAVSITEEEKELIQKTNLGFANDALRVLAVAYRELDAVGKAVEQEHDLIFLGLLGMIDPPREEAKDAVSVCKKAGIKVKMITGDHKITASAIGRELGIIDNIGGAIEGREIDKLSDEELREKVKNTSVFARVSPEHKVRLVTAIRENGDIAAMTGDGVNDAPSLKRADIGIAMGITGTDVSKEAADMILTDDNFASIVKAVEEGRVIYNNIRKVVSYLLSCNIGEILVIFVAMLVNLPVPLMAVQLLSINLITDAFPAFALGMEKKEAGIMDVPPRDPNAPIVDRKMQISVVIQSIFLAAGALGSFIFAYNQYAAEPYAKEIATTFCFVTLVLGELLRAYSARSEDISILKFNVLDNSFLNKSVLLSIVFLFATVYIPFLNPIFKTYPLALEQLGLATGFAILPLIGGELSKILNG